MQGILGEGGKGEGGALGVCSGGEGRAGHSSGWANIRVTEACPTGLLCSRQAGHSSKAAIKSRTFSPIIPLAWTPTPTILQMFRVSAPFFCPGPTLRKTPRTLSGNRDNSSHLCLHRDAMEGMRLRVKKFYRQEGKKKIFFKRLFPFGTWNRHRRNTNVLTSQEGKSDF